MTLQASFEQIAVNLADIMAEGLHLHIPTQRLNMSRIKLFSQLCLQPFLTSLLADTMADVLAELSPGTQYPPSLWGKEVLRLLLPKMIK